MSSATVERGGGTALAEAGEVSLVDLLDRLLGTGVVLAGDVLISLAGVDLVQVRLHALITSVRADMPVPRHLRDSEHDMTGLAPGAGRRAGDALDGARRLRNWLIAAHDAGENVVLVVGHLRSPARARSRSRSGPASGRRRDRPRPGTSPAPAGRPAARQE